MEGEKYIRGDIHLAYTSRNRCYARWRGTGEAFIIGAEEAAILQQVHRPLSISELVDMLREKGWQEGDSGQVRGQIKELIHRGLLRKTWPDRREPSHRTVWVPVHGSTETLGTQPSVDPEKKRTLLERLHGHPLLEDIPFETLHFALMPQQELETAGTDLNYYALTTREDTAVVHHSRPLPALSEADQATRTPFFPHCTYTRVDSTRKAAQPESYPFSGNNLEDIQPRLSDFIVFLYNDCLHRNSHSPEAGRYLSTVAGESSDVFLRYMLHIQRTILSRRSLYLRRLLGLNPHTFRISAEHSERAKEALEKAEELLALSSPGTVPAEELSCINPPHEGLRIFQSALYQFGQLILYWPLIKSAASTI